MIETPPFTLEELLADGKLIDAGIDMASKYSDLIKKCDGEYLYWDRVKYLPLDAGANPKILWAGLRYIRSIKGLALTLGHSVFSLYLTPQMQHRLHFLDMNTSRPLGIAKVDEHELVASSLMEEAIASSIMEGASTTRRVAKDMLRKKQKPQTKGARMVMNNFETIQYLSAHRSEMLTEDILLYVHKLMTQGTLENRKDEGSFRTSDDVHVYDHLAAESVYIPPARCCLQQELKALYDFFNDVDASPVNFIHPVVKAIIIHFYLTYLHPFVDGNGRTARSLFYWYLLKNGYDIMEFLSISRIIHGQKNQYEKAFLYVENDGNDITYFIKNQLDVLEKAVGAFHTYLKRKIEDEKDRNKYVGREGVNERQASLLAYWDKNTEDYVTVEEYSRQYGVVKQTARNDLRRLCELGYVREFPFNKRKSGFRRNDTT